LEKEKQEEPTSTNENLETRRIQEIDLSCSKEGRRIAEEDKPKYEGNL